LASISAAIALTVAVLLIVAKTGPNFPLLTLWFPPPATRETYSAPPSWRAFHMNWLTRIKILASSGTQGDLIEENHAIKASAGKHSPTNALLPNTDSTSV
jgi:hypothetical protein